MRPDGDSYFMKIAYAVSERSTCDRAFVGCVLVLDKRILTTGFNGFPPLAIIPVTYFWRLRVPFTLS
jgi:deoxycytidylate deaminase